MNIIAQLGRAAARQMMKQAAPEPDFKMEDGSPAFPPGPPDQAADYGNHFLRSNIQPLPTESDPDAASARERFRNVPVPGGGGSMWGDEVLGRGGVHPNSRAANRTINKQYGAPTSPIVDRTIGANWPGGDQSAQSKRLLAQDPRGRGGWAYEATPQQRPVSQTNSNPWAIYGGSAATDAKNWGNYENESTPGSSAIEPRRSNNYGM